MLPIPRKHQQKYPTLLVLLLAGVALVWLDRQVQPDSVSPTSETSSSADEDDRDYAYHSPDRRFAVLQRLWLALTLGETQSLELDPSTLNMSDGFNQELIFALWAHLQGSEHTTSKRTRANLDFLLERPGDLVGSLHFQLLNYESKEKMLMKEGATTGLCPIDASVRLEMLPDGTIRCPRESEPDHQKLLHELHMLFDDYYTPRPGDMAWLEQVLEIAPGHSIVDVGAGVGAYTFPLAELVGDSGKVWAVEISSLLVTYLDFIFQELEISNVETVLGVEDDLRMPPATADMVLVIDLGIASSTPEQFFSENMNNSLASVLKPDGKLVILRNVFEDVDSSRYTEVLKPFGFVLETDQINRGINLDRELLVFRKN